MKETLFRPTWAETDLKALRHNFSQIKRLGKGKKILAVIKADAYGHGMIRVGQALERAGADFFGVADIREAMGLRIYGIKKPILLFENTLPYFARQIVELDLTPSVSNIELARSLNDCAAKAHKRVNIHVKVDTGMGRLGVWHEEAIRFIEKVRGLKNVNIQGIMTHFACADTDKVFTKRQIARLIKLLAELKKRGIIFSYVHAANSIGFVEYQDKHFSLYRLGLILYGMYPAVRLKSKISLKLVLSVKSRIVFLKRIEKGRSVSYGRTFIAKKKMTIATLPVGYNDGYFRSLSNKSFVLAGGRRCPVVGRVTMDQMMVDVSSVKNPKIGMEVVLLGRQGKQAMTADELAQKAGTINYEITCSLGNRLPRVYRD